MKQQINFVTDRDGAALGIEYAKRALAAYRSAAKHRNASTGRRHFVHEPIFRAHVVRGIAEIRQFLREAA